MKRVLALIAVLPAACATPSAGPSLAPRAAEKIDPRVPVGEATPPLGSPSAALVGELSTLVANARQGIAAFDAALPATERLVAAAGAPQSESWIEAVQAVSALESLRSPVTTALSRMDEIAAEQVEAKGGIAPADLAAINAARSEIDGPNQRQADALASMNARLGG